MEFFFLQKDGSNEVSKFIFCNEEASLQIEHDPDSVYDVSRKHHIFRRSDISVRYTTYFISNSLEIIVAEDTVSISTIDGGCDVIINGLEWSYSADENTEQLYLYVSTDIGLWKRKTGISSYVLKVGSLLCFDIKREDEKVNL